LTDIRVNSSDGENLNNHYSVITKGYFHLN